MSKFQEIRRWVRLRVFPWKWRFVKKDLGYEVAYSFVCERLK